jgi:hypothetical protein
VRGIEVLRDRATLEREYVIKGRASTEIAAALGCSHQSVLRALARHGIPRRNRGGQSRYPPLADRAWLQGQVKAGRPMKEIAAVGCGLRAIYRAVERHGIEPMVAVQPGSLRRLWTRTSL